MNRIHNQRGAAAIEFGLAFLLFFVMVCATMEFGRVVASYNLLAGATKEAARYAMVHGSSSSSPATADDVKNVVKTWAVGLDSESISVKTTWPSGNNPGNPVQVQANYTLSPFTNLVLKNAIALQSNSQLTITQ